MTRKSRRIIVFICVVIFLVAAPPIILYSLGYRIDIKHLTIVATGGIYVRTAPTGVSITIDSTNTEKTGLLSDAVFVQDLVPGQHSVSITKDGYFDYKKNLSVKENEVTKLEHITLIKKQTPVATLETNASNFFVAPDKNTILLTQTKGSVINFETITANDLQKRQLSSAIKNSSIKDVIWSADSKKALLLMTNGGYSLLDLSLNTIASFPSLANAKQPSFNPANPGQIYYIKNNNLFINTQTAPLLKNVAAYQVSSQDITWLSYDGFLYASSLDGTTNIKITTAAFQVKKANTYKLISTAGMNFLQENTALYLLNKKTQAFELYKNPVTTVKTSPDGQKIAVTDDHHVFITILQGPSAVEKRQLTSFAEPIQNFYWLNSDYLILQLQNTIVISEIDYRDTVNTVDLSSGMTVNNIPIAIKNPQIFFNSQDRKLYFLNQNSFFVSDPLTP